MGAGEGETGWGVAASELLVSSPILNHNPSTCQSDISLLLPVHARAKAAATLETMGSYSDDVEGKEKSVWLKMGLCAVLECQKSLYQTT